MNALILGRSDGMWLNEPEQWTAKGDSLQVIISKATDFWREIHYGFNRDSGHFLGFPTAEAFTAELRIQGDYQALYDQAGLMVRIDAHHWVKAGIEFSDGRAMLGSVLTDGQSDWATSHYEHDASDFRIRVTVVNGVLRLQASADGKLWPLMRLAPVADQRFGPRIKCNVLFDFASVDFMDITGGESAQEGRQRGVRSRSRSRSRRYAARWHSGRCRAGHILRANHGRSTGVAAAGPRAQLHFRSHAWSKS